MTAADVPAVASIDRLSNPLAWSEAVLAEDFAKDYARYLLLVDEGGAGLGFVGAWLVLGEMHITMIAVLPELRGRGLGEALLVAAIRAGLAEAQEVVTLEVRETNAAAIGLYRKYGFVEVGRRRRYYEDTGEDALIMTTPPLDSRTYRARFERLAAHLPLAPIG